MKKIKLTASKIGMLLLAIGALCALAATSRGTLIVQTMFETTKEFSIGRATLSKSDGWLLLDHRESSGAPHLKLGFIPSRENTNLPQGRYFSFEDVELKAQATFIEIDNDAAATVSSHSAARLGCQSIKTTIDRRLVQCEPDNKQILIYDLDRLFVVGISPAQNQMVKRVLTVIAK